MHQVVVENRYKWPLAFLLIHWPLATLVSVVVFAVAIVASPTYAYQMVSQSRVKWLGWPSEFHVAPIRLVQFKQMVRVVVLFASFAQHLL